jgi:hypothetical protein
MELDDDDEEDAELFLPKKAIRGALGGRRPLSALQKVCVECEVSCDSGDATLTLPRLRNGNLSLCLKRLKSHALRSSRELT